MSGFSPEWLSLREPYDAKARNAEVLEAVIAALDDHSAVSVVDLACGTGATLRALFPHLPARQHWRLADNDLGLLARVPLRVVRRTVTVAAVPIDLACDLEAALDGVVDLVTTSALLDLVSESWLNRLCLEVAARRVPLYAALTYDGRIVLEPYDPLDTVVIAAVNAHQRRDKGFGPALGCTAAETAIRCFASLGYSVVHGPADWVLKPSDQQIQMELLAGWAAAAREIGWLQATEINAWLIRRRNAVAARRSCMRVGHVDFFARVIGTR